MPISLTELPITMRLKYRVGFPLRNALLPMDVTESGITICDILLQLAKAEGPIMCSDAGRVTSVIVIFENTAVESDRT